MEKSQNPSISVSNIVRASICPMQLYLASSSPKEFAEPIRYSAAKQLACHLGDTLNPDEIHRELSFALPDADEKAHRVLDEMIEACKAVQFRRAEACDVQAVSENIISTEESTGSSGTGLQSSKEGLPRSTACMSQTVCRRSVTPSVLRRCTGKNFQHLWSISGQAPSGRLFSPPRTAGSFSRR